jgi:hypothetical protein
MSTKSWKLVYRYTYNDVAVAGFPTKESAESFNNKYFQDTEGYLGTICHVVPDEYTLPYQKLDENGEVIWK